MKPLDIYKKDYHLNAPALRFQALPVSNRHCKVIVIFLGMQQLHCDFLIGIAIICHFAHSFYDFIMSKRQCSKIIKQIKILADSRFQFIEQDIFIGCM